MKYAALIYWNEKRGLEASAEHSLEIMRECDRHNKVMEAAGEFISGAPLAPTATAETVRVRNGKPLVSDGPFAETKEQLGGYVLIDCADRARAEQRAREILQAQQNYDGRIELYEIG